MNELSKFIPPEYQGQQIEIREEYAEVVERISQVLPTEMIWDMFASDPGATGGKVVFPYCRVDSAVTIVRERIYMAVNFDHQKEKEHYDNACEHALGVLAWVEVGFQGLENLAKSPASKNWTSAVGHHVSDEERAAKIMTDGKELYEECLGSFARYRFENQKIDDFTQYNLEYLLDPFLPR